EVDDGNSQSWLWQVLRSAFGQRRKTLLNALSSNLKLPKEEISTVLTNLGLEIGVRGENLTPEQFIDLANGLAKGM
ncbi:MAG TPA: 16S rRNA (adenine(1518)-N(6)/adenine(1519)-N(6))-dimethyltransferase, partial [Firmicutes bacterium]|nr:16S rRNA (adenine(1518)-N(6)/adenine(1519)-N(6))-dimethyltransferase [Bacillota bacterium]